MLEELFQAGVEAVKGRLAVKRALTDASAQESWYVMALGKAAESMVQGALDAGVVPQSTFLVTKHKHLTGVLPVKGLIAFETAHPVPDESSLAAGAAAIEWLAGLPEDSQLLLLVSGGASSLIEHLRPGISFEDLVALNKTAHAEGWAIEQINKKRRELSAIKGGELLRHFAGKTVRALCISDVEGDGVDVIGSGIGACPENAAFEYTSEIIASNAVARDAIETLARANQVQIIENTEMLYDDVEVLAPKLAQRVLAGPAGLYIWGGESTVRLPEDPGYGGRNQALALLFAREISDCEGILALFAGTDGTDGPTENAGGLVDGKTFAVGESASAALESADAGRYLQSVGAALKTGPTGTNVMDIALVLKSDS